jgi:hypothetical protein
MARPRKVYEPEVLKMMGAALDAAWAGFSPRPSDADLARLIMASAIFERADADDALTIESLVEKAIFALRAALGSPLLAIAYRPAATIKMA